ncbi:glycosyltransferase family 4 protein [Morganella morganii]|uniref:glycosyltransferase family 4 protein n=1 Tax=Morganella morganii TaxID=582 RepID=UPI0021A69769|nr:glycosyltransferase family 4 protein [Morganella morganii]
MKKIAHIQLLPLLSGVQRVCLDELLRLDSSKYKRFLICKEAGPLTIEAEKNGIECIFIPSLTRNISFIKDVYSLFCLIKIFKKYQFDIVHTHSSKPGILGRIAARLCSIKFIIHTVHGFSFPIAKNKIQYFIYYFMEKIGSMCGTMLICLHENDKEIATKILKIPEKDIVILENGIDINKYKKVPSNEKNIIKKQYNLSESDTVIGMTGRLWPQKNPLLLMNACKDIIIENPKIHIVYAGDGDLRENIESFIEKNNLKDNIHLIGWSNNISEILNMFDIFVLPSIYEGMPLAILEAQSTSLPCIASNIPGNAHIIENGITGLLFNSNSQIDLKEKIITLLDNPLLQENISANSRDFILKKHNVDDRINKLCDIYDNH